MLDFLRFRDGLPCAKRTFGVVIALGLIFLLLIYDFNSRNGYFTRMTVSSMSAFSMWNSTTVGDLSRPFDLPKQTPTRKKDTSRLSRIQEKLPSTAKKDFINSDKKPRILNDVKDLSVDSNGDKLTDRGIRNEGDLNNNVFKRENSSRITQNGKPISSVKDFIKRLPNAIIIGVKKGGTRALLEILKIHPSIRACNREVHFFDRDSNYERGLSWYKDNMPASFPEEITIEKSPAYFVTSKVPERVYRMSKSVKLLVVVRDPTRRAISDYTQSLAKKPDNYPFETFAVKDLQNGIVNVKWMKLKIGLYAKYLEEWLKFFPRRQIHFVSGEELIHNPAKEIKQVEKFLDLKGFITKANFVFNETKGFYCLVGKRTDGESRGKVRCMGKSKGRTHPKVPNSVITLLNRYFRPHNLRFYAMVNRNFGWP